MVKNPHASLTRKQLNHQLAQPQIGRVILVAPTPVQADREIPQRERGLGNGVAAMLRKFERNVMRHDRAKVGRPHNVWQHHEMLGRQAQLIL